MIRGLEGRLRRLEKRRPNDPYAHLTDEELLRRREELLVQSVEEYGLDETRARCAQPPFAPTFTQDLLDDIARLQADGRIPPG